LSEPAETKPVGKSRKRLPDWLSGNVLLLPTTVWFIFLLIIPSAIIIKYSLGHRGFTTPVRFSWSELTFQYYRQALDPRFLPIFQRSVLYAVACTVLCLLLGFPLAYWIARFGGRFRTLLLVLVIIPFLTSYLIRIYAWQFILQRNGLLNSVLGTIGLGDNHAFLNTHYAVILGLTYGFLPFMILPLYATIERMDHSLVEASYDLGHGKASTFWKVIVPSVMPGIVAGVLLVFIPAIGDFITPELLGGTKTTMYGQTIADQFGGGNNWPLGSAMSVLLMLFILLGVYFYLSRVGEDAL
jgi:spermidine/putrescine transport system permease protein